MTAPPPASASREILDFGRFVFRNAGKSFTRASLFLLLGSLTEGLSIVLLLPLLTLLGRDRTAIAIDLAQTPLRFFSTATLHFSLALVLAIFVALVAARSILMGYKEVYNTRVTYGFVNHLRQTLFASVAGTKWATLARMRSADIHHALTADIDRVRLALVHLQALLQGVVLTLIYLSLSLFISPLMTIIGALIGTVLIAVMHPLRQRAQIYGGSITGDRQIQYRIVAEFLAGMKLMKSFGTEQRHVTQLAASLDKTTAATIEYMSMRARGGVQFQIGSAVALAVFVYLALTTFALSLPEILVMLLLFTRLAPRFLTLQSSTQDLLSSLGAFHAMNALKTLCDGQAEPVAAPAPFPRLVRHIVFDDVGFRFDDHLPAVVSNLSMRIPANRITALIGPTGSGKSTIADLLMGLQTAQSGGIRIDGVALDAQNQRGWRTQLAYVPQDSFLLHDTIAANLRIADAGATDEELLAALATAHAAGFVLALPQGLETVVGDRGQMLSGGERQRIALARALLRRPSLLVLDEATSALDWESQSAIADAVSGLRGRMTIVTIAHRPSMIAFADHVIAIRDGRVIETGDFAALNASRDSYLRSMISGENVPA